MTAKALRQALIPEKGGKQEELPCEKTISHLLNRFGFRLRRVQKAKPFKKGLETDAIFDHLHKINTAADLREDSLRISMDTQAKIDRCNCSRGGTSRGRKAVPADDHDRGIKDQLTPFGILEVMTGLLTMIFGVSFETRDFIVDGLPQGWDANKIRYPHIKPLVINLDNGPHHSSHRPQFIKRMVEFADKNNLEIVLAYYPPYQSKYNLIERCWGLLEHHWSGTLLNTIETSLEWAKTMTWKGLHPVVKLVETTYKKGIRMAKKAFKTFADRVTRDVSLRKYFMTIQPQV